MEQQQDKGEGVPFERIRRITGYLVGTIERFNNAKQAEVKDRIKHTTFLDAHAVWKGDELYSVSERSSQEKK